MSNNKDAEGTARRPDPGASGDDAKGRRAFLKGGVGVLGAGLGGAVALPAVRYVAFPLSHEVTSSGGAYIVVGKRKQFGKTPTKTDIFADRVDAWNRVRQVKIGSAWVVDQGGELVALSTVCPHLGCAIDFDDDADKFKCPCHRSAFALSGEREEGPSPRGMDRLDLREQEGLVEIRYQRFKQGSEDKEPV